MLGVTDCQVESSTKESPSCVDATAALLKSFNISFVKNCDAMRELTLEDALKMSKVQRGGGQYLPNSAGARITSKMYLQRRRWMARILCYVNASTKSIPLNR